MPMPDLATKGLYPVQVRAITNLERSLRENRPRALVQMATGIHLPREVRVGPQVALVPGCAERLHRNVGDPLVPPPHVGVGRVLRPGRLGRQDCEELDLAGLERTLPRVLHERPQGVNPRLCPPGLLTGPLVATFQYGRQ